MKKTGKQFNDTPTTTTFSGTPLGEKGRTKSMVGGFKSVTDELAAHQSQGITVEPQRRAKIAHGLVRDHHRAERKRGASRGIVKGKVS